jgi:hypothetical protein
MIIKTPQQLEKIFLEIKPSFPEVHPLLREIVLRKHRKYSMLADVLWSGDILYNNEILGEYSAKSIRGIFAHEFGHLVNQRGMKSYTKEEKERHQRKYDTNKKYRTGIERAASQTAVFRGFGRELIFLTEEAICNGEWKNRYANEHLTIDEIKKLMKRN